MSNYTSQQLTQLYSDQLGSRFHANATATEVLITLIFIMMLVVEVIKFIKKTYEWQTEYEINLDNKYNDDSNIGIRESQHEPLDNQNDQK